MEPELRQFVPYPLIPVKEMGAGKEAGREFHEIL